MALTTSCAARFWRSRAFRSRSTETTRCLPPKGYGMPTPGTLMRPTRTVFKARSKVCCSESILLLMPYCKNRNGGGVVLDDQRRGGARRKLFQNGLRFRGDLGHTGIRRNALVEKNFYDGHTIVR